MITSDKLIRRQERRRQLQDDRPIVYADTSVGSMNVGDYIIRDASLRQIHRRYPNARLLTVPTHTPLGSRGREILRDGGPALVGGTNIVGMEWNRSRPWAFGLRDALAVRQSFLGLGVGLFSYQARNDRLGRLFLRQVLANNGPHSTRDVVTAEYLKTIGFERVHVTGCPTTWDLDQSVLNEAYLGQPAESVVFAVNSAKQSSESVTRQLNRLAATYSTIHVWRQRPYDEVFDMPKAASLLEPTLTALDAALVQSDYVGARLHAGIRALEHGRRSLILSVDNRAVEMGETSGLPVVSQSEDHEAAVDAFASNDWPVPQLVDRTSDIEDFWKDVGDAKSH